MTLEVSKLATLPQTQQGNNTGEKKNFRNRAKLAEPPPPPNLAEKNENKLVTERKYAKQNTTLIIIYYPEAKDIFLHKQMRNASRNLQDTFE